MKIGVLKMMIEKIEEILLNCGYLKKEFYTVKNKENIEFEFDNIYVNADDTEMYILVEDYVSEVNIKKYHDEILFFQNWYNNEILIYNINLILIYNNDSTDEELRNLIYKYEKDAHLCRKIFIDSLSELNDLEFDILPFRPLGAVKISNQSEQLKKNIISLLGNIEIYNQLTMDYKDIDEIKKNLLV